MKVDTHAHINVDMLRSGRARFERLLEDLSPSAHRSLAEASLVSLVKSSMMAIAADLDQRRKEAEERPRPVPLRERVADTVKHALRAIRAKLVA